MLLTEEKNAENSSADRQMLLYLQIKGPVEELFEIVNLCRPPPCFGTFTNNVQWESSEAV